MRYLVLLSLLLAVPAMALELYVSPSGKDTNPGTKAAPFQTLEKARDAIRAAQPKGGATVWLWGGVYQLDRTFELTKEDTGTPEAPIVYRAVKPGSARLMGGAMLPASAFKPVTDPQLLARLDPSARAAVRQVNLRECGVPEPGPEWETRFSGAPTATELFFNHDRMTLARWPNNKEWTRVVDLVGGAPHKIHSIPGDKVGKFTYQGERPARWANEPDVWLHGYWFWDWSDQRQKIESIDTARKTISLTPPYHSYGYRKNARYYAMNALCELDSPGEWYIDRASWTLLFWPPDTLGDHEVSLSLLADPLVKMTDVSNVTLRDLTLEVSRGEGVQIMGGADNLIAGCTLRNLPRLAVRVEGGLRHGVQSCDMYNLGAGGISLNGGDRRTLTPAGHYADNNHIHHFAQLVFAYQNAIRLAGVGNRMTHNLVHDTIHEALSYSGNDHLVEFNEVYNVCLEADDSGVIHQGRDWTWRGNIIRHNFFHDIVAGNAVSNMGVYLDDMESGVEVSGNVLYRIPRAILVGGGRDNKVTGNLIIDCPIPVSIDNRAMNWASYHVGTTMKGLLDKVPYTEEPWRSRYPRLPGIWEDEPGTPKGNGFTDNLMVRCGKPSFAAEVGKFGIIANNLEISDDPGFADAARLDFSLKANAPVYKQLPGFTPIPFEKMGVYLDDYRKALPVKTPVLNPGPGAYVDELTLTMDIAAR
ncbi:MAG: right-handed parallel beta-helix repeat-containing protein, partial [Bacteroidota bacterium]